MGRFFAAFALVATLSPYAWGAAEPSDGLRGLIEAHAADASVVSFNPHADRYELLSWSRPEDLARVLALHSPDRLENDHFRMLGGESDTTLPFTDFDGRNVLYHLELARCWYEARDPSNPSVMRKITVRVRVENVYNLITHFGARHAYNNSGYFPADFRGGPAEIWFFSPKASIDWKSLALSAAGGAISAATGREWGLIGAAFGFIHAFDSGMDLAKVPSVIYHETFHYASDAPYPFQGAGDRDPISEDLANYFGTVINGKPVIAEMEDFVDGKRKRSFKHLRPIIRAVAESYNYTGFLPSFLWKLRGWQTDPARFDQEIWNSMHELTLGTNYVEYSALLRARLDHAGWMSELAHSNTDRLFSVYRKSFENLDKAFDAYFRVMRAEPASHPSF